MTNDEKALIALLIAAFLLSRSDIDAMAAAILVGRIDSMKASYAQSSDTVGIDDTNWEPSDDQQSDAKDISEQDAESIASTYKSELTNQVEAFVVGWMSSHDDSLDGCEAAARKELSKWATSRSAWKSEQIANYTCGSGAYTGIEQWVANVKDGEFDLPDDVTLDDIELTVLPEESSHDECEDYAGKTFSLDEYDDIIEFPAHAGCPHRVVVVMKDE